MASQRLTRQESQRLTRGRLIETARETFIERGIERATAEGISERAGFSKGAFYGHFRNVEDVCLAVFEQGVERYLSEFSQVLDATGSPSERARAAAKHLSQMVEDDPEDQRLFFEFALYAMRRPEFRSRVTAQYQRVRAGVAASFEIQAEAMALESPIPYERLARMMFITGVGTTFARLLEPESFEPSLYGELLGYFFAGLGGSTGSDGP